MPNALAALWKNHHNAVVFIVGLVVSVYGHQIHRLIAAGFGLGGSLGLGGFRRLRLWSAEARLTKLQRLHGNTYELLLYLGNAFWITASFLLVFAGNNYVERYRATHPQSLLVWVHTTISPTILIAVLAGFYGYALGEVARTFHTVDQLKKYNRSVAKLERRITRYRALLHIVREDEREFDVSDIE